MSSQLYVILDWHDEVPSNHLIVASATQAKKYAKGYCRTHSLPYFGIEDVHYFPSDSARQSMVVSPMRRGLKRGNYCIAATIVTKTGISTKKATLTKGRR